jgi:hypothetical protein
MDFAYPTPFELSRIMREIAAARVDPATTETAGAVAFMIDQSHNVEGTIDAMVQSVVNIQTAYAKALLVDGERLEAAQREGDVLGAHRVLVEAFETDVRPLLGRVGFVNSVVADLQGNLAESGRHHERSQTAEPMALRSRRPAGDGGVLEGSLRVATGWCQSGRFVVDLADERCDRSDERGREASLSGRLDEDKIEQLRRWGAGLANEDNHELRATGKAILLLIEEIEGLHIDLWNAKTMPEQEQPNTDHEDARSDANLERTLLARLRRLGGRGSSPGER